MRRVLFCIVIAFLSLTCYAQKVSDTAIRFLDIPVDGTPYEFATRLEKRGFSVKKNVAGEIDGWTGSFNGEDVKLYFDSFRGKVYVVLVEFPARNHKAVKDEYNNILLSLNDNDKYLPNDLYNVIPPEEDIRRSLRNGNKYIAKYAYLSPDHFSTEESGFLHRLGKKIMSMEQEEVEDFMEAYKTYLSESMPENATIEDSEMFLKKLESIVYNQLALSISKHGFSYHVILGYINDKNAPSSDGRDL